MSERNVLKLDINGLTEFQKELHFPDPSKPITKKNKVNSRFSCIIEKNSWSAHTKAKMNHISEEGEVKKIIYTASKKFDVIFKSSLHINLIPIKVKDKYKSTIQICYPHNLGHNITNKGELKIDDDHHQFIDSIWLDICSQFYMKKGAGMRDLYDRMIGNVSCLEDWGCEMPGIPLIVPQPYSYSRNTRVGLKTLRSSMNTVTYHYNIRNKIREILRMRVKNKDKEWVDIQCNLKYLDIKENAKEIPIPELWARYSLMTDAEREWHKNIPKYVIYTEDIIITNSNNPVSLGSIDVIPLHCKVPCKSLFWVAQNIKFIKNRNFSNYTTTNTLIGWNPCAKASLKYGGSNRVQELSHEHFDLEEPWDFCKSAPDQAGYNVHVFGYDLTTLNADTAMVLEPLNASLHIKLDDTNPFLTIEEPKEEYDEDGEVIPIEALENDNSDETDKDKYIIHVRALVYKKLEMSWNKKDERIKYLMLDDATKKETDE